MKVLSGTTVASPEVHNSPEPRRFASSFRKAAIIGLGLAALSLSGRDADSLDTLEWPATTSVELAAKTHLEIATFNVEQSEATLKLAEYDPDVSDASLINFQEVLEPQAQNFRKRHPEKHVLFAKGYKQFRTKQYQGIMVVSDTPLKDVVTQHVEGDTNYINCLTRHPTMFFTDIPKYLSCSQIEGRVFVATTTTIEIAGAEKEVRDIDLHTTGGDKKWSQRWAARQFMAEQLEHPADVYVACGDFNMQNPVEVAKFFGRDGWKLAPSGPTSTDNKRRIDYCLYQGQSVEVIDSEVHHDVSSDHYALQVNLALPHVPRPASD